MLRGLVWSCATLSSPAVAALVGDLAVVCFAKIPNFGAVSPKVGNGCVFTLGACPGLTGVAQLARLKTRVKYAVANRLIEKAFDAAAKRTGFGRAELEDLSVPTFGLTGPGAGDFDVGEWSARITIGGDDTVSLTWRSPAGKEQAGVPAEVSRDHAATVKDLKKRVKDIGGMLTAQRLRLEGLLGGRAFALADFRSRILDHPLLAPIARRLVVEIRSGDRVTLAIWGDGDLVDVAGRAVADLSDDARVQLWHPIGSDVATVRAWRDVLYDRGITQPFKQAHREIYVLTDAERSTDTYSNRFAAHILRQHVLAALCRDRGWTYKLQGGFDGYNEPSRTIEGTELSAAFSVNPPEHAEAETSGAGIYLHVLSDHVRFYRGGREAVPLAEVPPLVFSETMRDIDLFVALASVGNDPDWVDRGNGQLGEYWQGFAFGELSATARTRHEVLERLLPRLKIADRCRLMDRFLVVRGDLRVYKIHLGSANILMEPNDQYLCIVPGRSSGSKGPGLRLPFEGDSTLSLILSKAILLAADTKIADPSIVGQIGRP
ncbi:MAG: DUF4132 domain-containing protein [Deltaproteobacteria bacterium]|nr:DUF4132 domain-containing protein [Deltaproteobacteria bacterium]